MARPKGNQNHATIVRQYLHEKFKDIAENDLEKILESVVEKATDGSLMAQKLILDNMDKIAQWETKNKEAEEGFKVFINRGGVVIEHGERKVGIADLGSHTLYGSKRDGLSEYYEDYCGPLQVKDKLDTLVHKEAETLYKWDGCLMSLGEICRGEGISHGRVYNLIKRYDMSVEDAVQEIIELTDHPANGEDNV